MVAKLAGPEEVGDGEDDTEDDTQTTHNEVDDAEEGVAATHDCAGRDKDRLGALVFEDGEV